MSVIETSMEAHLGLKDIQQCKGGGGRGCISAGKKFETEKGPIFVKTNEKLGVGSFYPLLFLKISSRPRQCSRESMPPCEPSPPPMLSNAPCRWASSPSNSGGDWPWNTSKWTASGTRRRWLGISPSRWPSSFEIFFLF